MHSLCLILAFLKHSPYLNEANTYPCLCVNGSRSQALMISCLLCMDVGRATRSPEDCCVLLCVQQACSLPPSGRALSSVRVTVRPVQRAPVALRGGTAPLGLEQPLPRSRALSLELEEARPPGALGQAPWRSALVLILCLPCKSFC